MTRSANRIDGDGDTSPSPPRGRTPSREADPFKLWLRQGLRAGAAAVDPTDLPETWLRLVDRLPPTD